MSRVLILDNGASTIKAGFADSDEQPSLISNAVVRSKGGGSKHYIGKDIEKCDDFFGTYYRRPFEKGILTDWDTEKAVWDNLFSPECLDVDTRATSLLVTEPYFNLPSIQDTYDQLVFEEYEFPSYLRTPAAPLLHYGPLFAQLNVPPPECYVVVDSGFSFTHIVPVMKGKVLTSSIKRIDIGGKLLTNYLKEMVSFRHWDMMEHFYVINEVKEKCCFVSSSFNPDLEACRSQPRRNPIVQEYILPDFNTRTKGYIRSGPNAQPPSNDSSHIGIDGTEPQPSKPSENGPEPVLYMGNERFTVPEVLFHPRDVGLNQTGLPQAIAASISSLEVPDEIRDLFWANIGLIGGNFCIEGIVPRLKAELRALAPPDVQIGIYEVKNPITSAFHSLQSFVRATGDPPVVASSSKKGKSTSKNNKFPSTDFSARCVTREEYLEGGTNTCRKKFSQNWEVGFDLGNETKNRHIETVHQASHQVQKTSTPIADNGDGDGQAREGGMDEAMEVDDGSIPVDKTDPGKRRRRSTVTTEKRGFTATPRRGKGNDRGKGAGRGGGGGKARAGFRTRGRVGSSSGTKEAAKV